MTPGRRRWAVAVVAVLPLFWSGCTTVRVTATERSSIEQRLLTRSLERVAERLDTQALTGRTVKVELYTLTKDQIFAREFLRARLERRGIRMTPGAEADVTLQVFAAALAVDTADTLIGVPAMQAPILAVPIPEIALFKWERSRGHAQMQTYVYDANGRQIDQLPEVLGQAKYNRFTILVFITFTSTDLDHPPSEP